MPIVLGGDGRGLAQIGVFYVYVHETSVCANESRFSLEMKNQLSTLVLTLEDSPPN
jgi:hypothetical protein